MSSVFLIPQLRTEEALQKSWQKDRKARRNDARQGTKNSKYIKNEFWFMYEPTETASAAHTWGLNQMDSQQWKDKYKQASISNPEAIYNL